MPTHVHPDLAEDWTGEEVAWCMRAVRLDSGEVRTSYVARSLYDEMLAEFGQAWVDRYLARAEGELIAWEHGCEGGIN